MCDENKQHEFCYKYVTKIHKNLKLQKQVSKTIHTKDIYVTKIYVS